METKNWYVANCNGQLAGHDMGKQSAIILAEQKQDEEPDMEWEALCEERKESW